jgi:acyl carrier protein
MVDLRAALRRALVSRFGIKVALADDTGLFSGGLIDSLSVMDLVGFVEETIGYPIPPTEITFENFDSIESIVRYAGTLEMSGEDT